MLADAHKEHGSRWTTIATQLPGRTASAIKSYWEEFSVAKEKQDEEKKGEADEEKVVEEAKTPGVQAENSDNNEEIDEISEIDSETASLSTAVDHSSAIEQLLMDEEDQEQEETKDTAIETLTPEPTHAPQVEEQDEVCTPPQSPSQATPPPILSPALVVDEPEDWESALL